MVKKQHPDVVCSTIEGEGFSRNHPPPQPSPSRGEAVNAWGLTSGAAGMQAQVRALAEALGVACDMKTVQLRKPFVALPNAVYTGFLGHFIVPHLMDASADDLSPPIPDLVISCGRRAAAVALGLRRTAPPSTRFIHIQDPYVDPACFDVVVAMEHDAIAGDNVIKTRFALHRITHEALKEAAAYFAPHFAAYAPPYTSVLIGGSTQKYTLSDERMQQVIAQLQRVLAHNPGALLITASRRTGIDNMAMLRQAFSGNPRVYVYDFVGENPYMGQLALADAIIVTDDSVNMMSEARASGKAVYILPLPGHANTKPARFAEMLIKDNLARPLTDTLERWQCPVSGGMEKLAQQVSERLRVL